ncbi:MAG: AcrR family transcriptional regulator [Planctomycetota bacterium]|jgi:AcrR family transcriptional regulator
MTDTQDGRHERSEATRAKLLEAAASLFAERGYKGTTLDAIAAAGDSHRALVRYHFKHKQGLYSAILREAIELGMTLLAPVQQSSDCAARRLSAFIDALGELLDRRPHFGPIITREWMSGGAHMEPEVMAALLGFFQADSAILEQGSASGEFRALDTHSAHLALVGSLVFFQVSRPVRERRETDLGLAPLASSDHLQVVKSIFLRGLRP